MLAILEPFHIKGSEIDFESCCAVCASTSKNPREGEGEGAREMSGIEESGNDALGKDQLANQSKTRTAVRESIFWVHPDTARKFT